MFWNFLVIGVGATCGAWGRWGLGALLNPVFPSIPLGTLAANLIGGYLVGVAIVFMRQFSLLPESVRLAVVTGFLGGLTTFSTFSAETTHLLTTSSYFLSLVMILLHVGGSLIMTFLGMYTVKLVFGG